ncbi:MAG: M48 family metalloprotease, partial [Elusimicrobia bacterium]|nr:M48 family metalloprotease [Elusimicrobiota bacterium]
GAPGAFKGPRAGVGPQAGGPLEPEFVDPVTTAVAAESLVGLVKIFAALWGPVMATLLSMASSRTREGHADEAGAALTQDPASLALGLGMLITWRPAPGFTLRRELLPIIASQSHVMIVNPIEQLHQAGALPKFGGVTSALVGPADDFFFNLFVTHPDTMLRIARLHDMALALGQGARK